MAVYQEHSQNGHGNSVGFENFLAAQVLWDETMAEAIANLKSFNQLFVISHDDTFETITESIIRVESSER